MSNMACSLIENKRITTTVAKAKALRKYAEPLITKSKNDTTHSRRVVFSYLQSKEAVKELFDVISNKVAERNGGYTRIIKLGTRLGDNAELAMIELVDFNENLLTSADDATKKSRRSRRGGKKASGEVAASTSEGESSAEVVEEAPVAETAVEETPETSSEESTDTEEEKA